jgi:hypothetical protein
MLPPFFRFVGFLAVRILHGCHYAAAWAAELPSVHAALVVHAPFLISARAHVVLLAACTMIAVVSLRHMLCSFFHFASSALQILVCLALWAEIWPPAAAFVQLCMPLLTDHTLFLLLLSAATALVALEVLALLGGIESD